MLCCPLKNCVIPTITKKYEIFKSLIFIFVPFLPTILVILSSMFLLMHGAERQVIFTGSKVKGWSNRVPRYYLLIPFLFLPPLSLSLCLRPFLSLSLPPSLFLVFTDCSVKKIYLKLNLKRKEKHGLVIPSMSISVLSYHSV